MRKKEIVDEAQGLVLDAKYEQFEWAKRAAEEARRELGGVIASVGLSASARRIDRSRQWCLQVAQAAAQAEKEKRQVDARSQVGDLIESIRRSGVLEPLVVQFVDEETLKVVDGHRRLRAAIDAGVSNLPVNIVFMDGPDESDQEEVLGSAHGPHLLEPAEQEPRTEIVKSAEAAARSHRRIRFVYEPPQGERAERTVDAWGVVFRTGSWYLVGHDLDRNAVRTFRMSRVVGELTELGEGSKPPAGFAAGANVWGKLDPDFIEVLEEVFRGILREERPATVETRGAREEPGDLLWSLTRSSQEAPAPSSESMVRQPLEQIDLIRQLLIASTSVRRPLDREADDQVQTHRLDI